MSTKNEIKADSALIAKLKEHKQKSAGRKATTLPSTGVSVSWPEFKPHGIWMKANRLAKGNPQSTMDFYLPLICRFDGENMTIAEFRELIPTEDVLHLIGEVMGDDATEPDDEGNALH